MTASATEEGWLEVQSDDESTTSSSYRTAYTRASLPRKYDNMPPPPPLPTVIRVSDRSPSTVYEDFDDDSGSSDIDDEAVQRLQLPSLAELLDGKARASGTYTIAPSRPIINEDAYENDNDSNSSDIDDDAVAAFDLPSLDMMAGRMAGVGAGMNLIGAGSSAHHPPPSSGPSEARRTSGSPEYPEEFVQKQRSPDSLYTSTPSPGPSYYQRPVSSSQAPPTPAYSVASFVSRTTDESALDVGDHYQSRYHYTPFDSISSRGTRPSSYRGSIDQAWFRPRGSVDSRASGGQYAAYRSRGSVDSRASSVVDEFGALHSRETSGTGSEPRRLEPLPPDDVPEPPADNELGLRLSEMEKERAARQPSTSTFGTGASSHLQPQPSQSSVSSSESSSDTPYATPKTSFTNARASINSRGAPPVPPLPAALARRVSTASSASSASNIFISPNPRGPRPRDSFVSNADTHTTDESALDVGDKYISWADRLTDQMPYAHFVGRAPGGGRYAAFGAFAALEADVDDDDPRASVHESDIPPSTNPSMHTPSDPSLGSSSTATLPSTAKPTNAAPSLSERHPSSERLSTHDRGPPSSEQLSSSREHLTSSREHLPSSREHLPSFSERVNSSMEQVQSTSDLSTTSSTSETYAMHEPQKRYPTTILDSHGRERDIYPDEVAYAGMDAHEPQSDVYGREAEMYRAPSLQSRFPDRVIPPAVPAKDMHGAHPAPFPHGHPTVAWERQKPNGQWERMKPNGDWESFTSSSATSSFIDESYEEARRHSASLGYPGGSPEFVTYSPEDWARYQSAFPNYEARLRQLQERGYDASDPEDDGPEAPYGFPGMPHPYPPHPYPYSAPYDPAYGPPPMDDERAYYEGWYGNRTLSIIEEESAEHLSSVGMPGHSDIDPREQRSMTDTDEVFRRQAMRSNATVASSAARISFTESMPSSLCALKSIPSHSTMNQTPRTIPSSDSLFSDAQSMSRGAPGSSSSSSDLPPSTPRLTGPSSMPSTSSLETPETTPLTDRSPRPREKELVRENSGSTELGFGHLFVARPQTIFSGKSSTRGSGPSEGDWRDSGAFDRWLPGDVGLQAPARVTSPTPVVQKSAPSKPQRPAVQSPPTKMQPAPSRASSVQSTPSRATAQRDYYKSKYGEELQTLVSSDDESDIVLHPRRQVPPSPQKQTTTASAQKGKQPQVTPQSSSSMDTGYEPLTDSGLSIDDGKGKRSAKPIVVEDNMRSRTPTVLDTKEARDRASSSSKSTPSKPVIPYTSRSTHGYTTYSHAQESSAGSRAGGATDVDSEYSSQSYSKLPPRPVAPMPSSATSESNASVSRPKTPSILRPKTPASSSCRSKTPALVDSPSRSKTPVSKHKSKPSKTESEVEWYSYTMDQSTSSISAHRTESPAPVSERSHGRSDKSRSDKSQSRSDKSTSRSEKTTTLRPRQDRPDSRASRAQDQTGKTKSRLLDDGTEITTSYQRITQDMLDRFMPHSSASSDGHQSTSTPGPSRAMEDSSRSQGRSKTPSVAAPTPRRADAPSTSSRSSTPATRAKTPSTARSSTPSARSSTPKATRPSSSASSRTPQPTTTSIRSSQASSSSRPSQQSSSSTRKKERPVPVPSVPPVPGLPLAVQAVANAHAARTGSRIAQVPPNSQAPVIPRGVHIPRSASSAGYAASSSSVSEY
ncbi:hypothetical protein GGF50DRAFT_101877 [Schizophyllum commune]